VEINGVKTTLRLNKSDAERLGVKQAAPSEKPAEEPVTEEPKEPAEPPAEEPPKEPQPPAEEPKEPAPEPDKEPAPPKGTKAKNVTAVANKARRPDDVGTK
jgi:outer membrane biosynthesis protein TonB